MPPPPPLLSSAHAVSLAATVTAADGADDDDDDDEAAAAAAAAAAAPPPPLVCRTSPAAREGMHASRAACHVAACASSDAASAPLLLRPRHPLPALLLPPRMVRRYRKGEGAVCVACVGLHAFAGDHRVDASAGRQGPEVDRHIHGGPRAKSDSTSCGPNAANGRGAQ